MLCLSSYTNRLSLFRGHQTVTMNHCCYCFDGPWKVRTKYIVLHLNVFAKLENPRGKSHLPVLMGNCPTRMPWPYQFTDIYAGKLTQKYSKNEKERWSHTN